MKRWNLIIDWLIGVLLAFSWSLAVAQNDIYVMQASDFGYYDANETWVWNEYFNPLSTLYRDENGNLNMQGNGMLVGEHEWGLAPAVSPYRGYQEDYFKWTDETLTTSVLLIIENFEDTTKNHTQLDFVPLAGKIVPHCEWAKVSHDPDPELWNLHCSEDRPEECNMCIDCEANGGAGGECGSLEPIPEACACVNLGIVKEGQDSEIINDFSRIGSVEILNEQGETVAAFADANVNGLTSYRLPIGYQWGPGLWFPVDWSMNPTKVPDPPWYIDYRVTAIWEMDQFTPVSGEEYQVEVYVDGEPIITPVGPGDFDVAVPFAPALSETAFVTPSGKETRKMLQVNNIAAFERDNGDLIIQWGEPIVDAKLDGVTIVLQPIVEKSPPVNEGEIYRLMVTAPPQTGTLIVPKTQWDALKDVQSDPATVTIRYRGISGKRWLDNGATSRCEVRQHSDPVPVTMP